MMPLHNIQILEFFSSSIRKTTVVVFFFLSEYFIATRVCIFHLKMKQIQAMSKFWRTSTLLWELNLWESLQYFELQYLKPLKE